MISGSYVGSEMNSPEEIIFTENILKYTYGGSLKNITTGEVQGAGSSYNFPIRPNEKTYAVPAPDCLLPVNGAYSTFIYTPGNYSAAIEDLKKVIELDEAYQNGNALYYLAQAYRKNNDLESAKPYYQRVIELFPNSERAATARNYVDAE